MRCPPFPFALSVHCFMGSNFRGNIAAVFLWLNSHRWPSCGHAVSTCLPETRLLQPQSDAGKRSLQNRRAVSGDWKISLSGLPVGKGEAHPASIMSRSWSSPPITGSPRRVSPPIPQKSRRDVGKFRDRRRSHQSARAPGRSAAARAGPLSRCADRGFHAAPRHG